MRVRADEETTADGLAVHINPKAKTLRVSCQSCGELLVVSESRHRNAALGLALRNIARNPCCDRWRHE